MRLPPGVSGKDFSDAIKQFQDAIGGEWVFTSDEDVDLYRDSYSPFWHEDEEPIPSAAVAPDGVEQVQAIVKIANQYKIPLWTISTGKNLGYGGSAPLLGGSVVLDLKRMDRILEVNEKNHYALVEPGVSYFDLYRYIQDNKLKVWIDPADPGWGSLIGNAVDRGGGRTPMRDHFDAVCGMEVVLPNGELMRTGMGALPGSKTWQQYKYGFGPYVTPLFSQSSLGIVTKMGIWLFPRAGSVPDGHGHGPEAGRFESADRRHGLPDEFRHRNGNDERRQPAEFPAPGRRADRAARQTWRPYDRGPREVPTRAKHGLLERRAAVLRSRENRGGAVGIRETKVLGNRRRHVSGRQASCDSPSTQGSAKFSELRCSRHPESFRIRSGRPRSEGHVWFSPIVPMTGEAVLEAHKVFTDAYREFGMSTGPMFFLAPPRTIRAAF